MAFIKPSSNQARQKHRARLSQGMDQDNFDRLAKLMDAPQNDLAWHHDVGKLVKRLHPRNHRGTECLINLARALGPSVASLQKSLRFVVLYPDRQGLKDLQLIGINWTRLHLSFPIKDMKARHNLLRQAVKEQWTDGRLRMEVQQVTNSPRRGVGGRPPKSPQNYGAEPTLRKLAQLNRDWLAFHANAWVKVKDADWKRLTRSRTTNDHEKLQNLVKITRGQIAEMATACRKVSKTLKDL